MNEQAVQGQAFGAGDEFVYRVGDGTTNLIAQPPSPIAGSGSIGSTIFVDEYTPAGTPVQSLILPSADGTGTQNTIRAVVGEGQQSATGQMSLSGDGQFLFLAGYDSNPLNVATAPEVRTNTVPRSVARIKYDGTVQTVAFTAGSSGVQTGGNFNGVWSPDGNKFYVSGANGVSYFSSFTPSASLQSATATITSSPATNGLEGAGGNLYSVVPSSTNLLQQYAGFPTAAATPSALPGVSATTDANQTFVIDAYFTHLNGTGAPAGVNTMYVSDDGPGFANGRITKWAYNGTTWGLVDSVVAGTGNTAVTFYWLAGNTDAGGNVTLYTTYGNGGNTVTGPGFLYAISDSNGYNAKIGTCGAHSDAVSTVASVDSASNEVFRGVALAPLPAVTGVFLNGPSTVGIASASAASTTVTIVTATPHGLYAGQLVNVAGVAQAGYNGVWTVASVLNATTFTYVVPSSLAATSVTGATETPAGVSITGAANSSTTVTITTSVPHEFYTGEVVTVAGLGNASDDGSFVITGVPTSTTFTYTGSAAAPGTLTNATASPSLSGAQRSNVNSIVYQFGHAATLQPVQTITNASEAGTTVTITTAAASGYSAGQTVTISGIVTAGYNGTFTITGVSGTTFTYTDPTSGLATDNGGGSAQTGFTLAIHTGQTGTLPTVSYSSPDGGFTWYVTFSGAGVSGGNGAFSIANGVYDVTLNQSAVTFNGSGATLTQSNRALDTFYRLYGDVNGDKRVNNTDFNQFAAAFNTRNTAAAYIAALDYNMDGRINNTDFNQFAADFNVRYSGFTTTI